MQPVPNFFQFLKQQMNMGQCMQCAPQNARKFAVIILYFTFANYLLSIHVHAD